MLQALLASPGQCKSELTVLAIMQELTTCAIQSLGRFGTGWVPESDVTVRAHDGPPLQLELVGFRRIEVTVNLLSLVAGCVELTKGNRSASPIEIAKRVVASMVSLWAGHYEYCPYDQWRHEQLCDAAATGGFGSLCVSMGEWKTATAIACFFERSTVTHALAALGWGAGFAEGVVQEHRLNNRPSTLLTDLFFRSQTLLAPRLWKPALARLPITPNPMAEGLLPEVMPLVFSARLRRARGKIRILSSGDEAPRQRDWADRVYRLARLLGSYLGESDSQQPEPFGQPFGAPPSTGAPRFSGQWNLPGEAPSGAGSSGTGPRCPGQAMPAGQPQAGAAITPGQRFDFDQLDRYYRQRASELPVESESPSEARKEKPDLITVGFLDSEPAGIKALVSCPIDWFGTRVRTTAGKNRLSLRRRSEPLKIPEGGDGPKGNGAPHLLLIVDSSGSMRFNPASPPPAERGQYDIVLTACYGIFAYLERIGAYHKLQLACINFSGRSIESGWHTYSNVRKIKEVLFRYQGGGTQLDPQVIRRTLESRPGAFLAVMITDGCLGNVPAAVAALERTVRAGCDLVLLHVGTPHAFTEALQAIRCPVHILQTAHDLIGLSLRIAQGTYQHSPK